MHENNYFMHEISVFIFEHIIHDNFFAQQCLSFNKHILEGYCEFCLIGITFTKDEDLNLGIEAQS